MGKFMRSQFLHSRSGTRIVSQNQRGRTGPPSTLAGQNGGSLTDAARFKSVPVNPADWTAVTTGYPGGPHDGTPTYYQADVSHSLNNARSVFIGLQDANGRDVRMQIVEATNEDPSNPGTLRYNTTRIWISSDAAPSATFHAQFVG